MTKLNTYLNFAGNTEEAFNFYKSVFGGEFTSLVRFKDMPMQGVNIPREDVYELSGENLEDADTVVALFPEYQVKDLLIPA